MAEATKERTGGRIKNKALRKQIGTNLAALRNEKELSQMALAEALPVPDGRVPWHYMYVGNVERGTQSPSQAFVRAAAEFFGKTPEEILGEVKLDDLAPGTVRARRGQRRQPRRTQPTETQATNGAVRRGNDPVGLHLADGVLRIVTGKTTIEVQGEFDGQIVDGRLRLAS